MSENNSSSGVSAFGVIGMGLAAVMSWMKWHSFLWAVIHAAFGWVYVFYYLIRWGIPQGW